MAATFLNPASRSATPADRPSDSASVVRILIVGGSEGALHGLSEMGQRHGWRLRRCASPLEISEILTEEQPSLILCDAGWWQPVLAQSRDLLCRTPLVVFTPLADEELWLDVIEAGGHDVLLAPFYERELVHIVNTALTPRATPKAQYAGG